ncbi:hypothetical protein GCK72_005172 [Caenorhabditis remanei]|uniref:GH18 domain-containing protein n=1 Tax=Caenorhabditis remanei TaxID=31234 RepID=A0A6A5HBT0_CAERE|nr:hypothetical protein GCK72_005172 [Caenorhabditis remanei]KAF1765220.1 hypothetical protein GCK72_005172 [Caenorhabditis remanei]
MPSRRNNNNRDNPLINRTVSDDQKCKSRCSTWLVGLAILVVCAPIDFVISEIVIHFFGNPFGFQDNVETVASVMQQVVIPSNVTDTTLSSHTTAQPDEPPAATCGKRIVGYYTEWEPRKITDKQLRKLTHLIFTNVTMNAAGEVNYHSSEQRRDFLNMKKTAKGKNLNMKVMFAIGGHLNSQYYSEVVADLEKRKTFINGIISFISRYQLDGVDLFWNWPEGEEDISNYTELIKQLRTKLTELSKSKSRKDPFLLSVVVPSGPNNFESYFKIDGFLDYVDFINIVAYDYYGPWGGRRGAIVGPNAPLYGGQRGNVDETMRYLICKTKKPNKLNMAVSFYGRYWMNVIDDSNEMWKTAELKNGEARGMFVPWKNLGREGWNKSEAMWHEETRIPYIWKPKERMFFVFENERSLKEKMDYAVNSNIGGVYMWALGADDDENTLLNLVSSTELCEGGSGDTINFICDF